MFVLENVINCENVQLSTTQTNITMEIVFLDILHGLNNYIMHIYFLLGNYLNSFFELISPILFIKHI